MEILHRAKHLYSDKYLISESIKFEFNQIYLLVKGRWMECEQDTRSIHFEDMLDSENNKIFASISEGGRGGDTSEITWSHPSNGTKETVKYIFKYQNGETLWVGRSCGDTRKAEWNEITGIQE